ncbi:hypothetical protein E2C01_091034 [Portunus trituberculatus]|uniref:Uncharacterized protein n=1 Tax=Portunus trituberculatus TaxID=210409 RepID=A0A5B7JRQ1_PORTR|nr:hypothetical protein [Portunus trituberculatus]
MRTRSFGAASRGSAAPRLPSHTTHGTPHSLPRHSLTGAQQRALSQHQTTHPCSPA